MPLSATINVDMGESYGPWHLGADEALMPYLDYANVACGYHAGDHDVMGKTAALAKKHGVNIGCHPGLPDLQGFGRREMHLPPASFFNMIVYQAGALSGFLKLNELEMSHYVMSSKNIELAREAARVAKLYSVPMLGLPGSAHQDACEELGVEFIPEFYADLQYTDEAKLLAPRSAAERHPITGEEVYTRVKGMLETSTWKSLNGVELKFPESTNKVSICVHGDFPGAEDVAKAVRKAIDDVKSSQ
ncbi:uncharacterized protein JCM6883_006036 [Sporobolomyces salmoneus]|uniref:uncharacterized protein n=1 Tax=Sporobolomyces salmoneus TaxID=183962 RepID=UPI00316D1A44